MRRYLLQLTTFLAPRSVDVADSTLRQLARWLITNRGEHALKGIPAPWSLFAVRA
jgi:class 3 adenylate cyclase